MIMCESVRLTVHQLLNDDLINNIDTVNIDFGRFLKEDG